MLPFLFKKCILSEKQKIIDSFVIRNSTYTKGKQRYLPSKEGGMGCISLYHHANATSQSWIKKLLNTNSIPNKGIHYALSTLGLQPLDLIYAAHWELKIISFFFFISWANILV